MISFKRFNIYLYRLYGKNVKNNFVFTLGGESMYRYDYYTEEEYDDMASGALMGLVVMAVVIIGCLVLIGTFIVISLIAAFAIATLFGIYEGIRHNAGNIMIENCGIYYSGGEHFFKSTIKCVLAKNNQMEYFDEPHWFGSIVDVYIMAVNLVTQRLLRILFTPIAAVIEIRRRKKEERRKFMDNREERIGIICTENNSDSGHMIFLEPLNLENNSDLK